MEMSRRDAAAAAPPRQGGGRRAMMTPFRAILVRQMNGFLSLGRSVRGLLAASYRFLARRVSPPLALLAYFLFLAFAGSLALQLAKPSDPSFRPKYVDMLYLSSSALTVSGLSTVEMEVLSLSHVVLYTLLMFLGGEVWVSLLGILARLPWLTEGTSPMMMISPEAAASGRVDPLNIELGSMTNNHNIILGPETEEVVDPETGARHVIMMPANIEDNEDRASATMKYRPCLRALAYVVFFYLLLIHAGGSLFIFLYLTLVPSANAVLKGKRIRVAPFAISVTVSSFANAGLIPTNENMAVFKTNAGLLLLIIPQILAGNTMFPVFLRLVIWALRRLTGREVFGHMMESSPGKLGYVHLMPRRQTCFLAATVAVFLAAQITLFCSLEWETDVLAGLSWFQKLVSVSFQTSNSRHAGEGTFDLSVVSPAMLVLFIVMMYLPAYTFFWPTKFLDDDAMDQKEKTALIKDGQKRKKRSAVVDIFVLSQLSYIAIFVVIVCILERKKMRDDPLNFSLLNVVFEVTSAYGNVGFSLGYSCARQITPDPRCKDAAYGFSGRFSTAGKLMVVFVMLFGRLKKCHSGGGRAWKLM